MKVTDACADCLYRKQTALTDREDYLSVIREMLSCRKEADSAPYLAYQFDRVYEEFFGPGESLRPLKKKYNALVRSMEDALEEDAKKALDGADVILAKGQANYETLSGEGRHVFYSLLCKCERFVNRVGAEPLTGVLIEENGEGGAV